MSRILVIIPARGGSQGIPRKNLRHLDGLPVVAYAIRTALTSRYAPTLVVSSDDEEILAVAEQFGAIGYLRDKSLADATTPLDPVICDATIAMEQRFNCRFDIVVTLQPTSPLLTVISFDRALKQFLFNKEIDTLLSATPDTHLRWGSDSHDRFVPLYEARANRQYIKPTFRETGAFLITRRKWVAPNSRLGPKVDLFLLHPPESIDIDTVDDFALCQGYLNRRRVVFVVTGNPQTGMGHVYRGLILASHLIDHSVVFFVHKESDLGAEKISAASYPVIRPRSKDWVSDLLDLKPDLVVNDYLDTDAKDIRRLKESGCAVINFEDLGSGAFYADRVMNDLYPAPIEAANASALMNEKISFGPQIFCARDEFRFMPAKPLASHIAKILVTFGGTDPNNLTEKVLETILPICNENGIEVTVILGLGVRSTKHIERFLPHVTLYRDVNNMAQQMRWADLVFTSAGRTVYESACVGTPGIVLAQNERELTHTWACPTTGFLSLGLGRDSSSDMIKQRLVELLIEPGRYHQLCRALTPELFKHGTERVVRIIRQVLVSITKPSLTGITRSHHKQNLCSPSQQAQHAC